MPSVETSRTYNQNTAAPAETETRSAQSSGSQDGPSTTSNNVNLTQLDTLQLLQHLSSRCAPAKALETIAAELITGRMWINLLAGPTAADQLSKFFGVTSKIQQTRLISEAQESIETDASETQRMADQRLRLRASEEHIRCEDINQQGIGRLHMQCPTIPRNTENNETNTRLRTFYSWEEP